MISIVESAIREVLWRLSNLENDLYSAANNLTIWFPEGAIYNVMMAQKQSASTLLHFTSPALKCKDEIKFISSREKKFIKNPLETK